MRNQSQASNPFAAFVRARPRVVLTLAAASVFALYLAGVPHNPPGFFVDESSIAYNAHLIAQTGADEHGARWPLYFRAFGEYKSPVYVYLLAGVYHLTGPSITSARVLSALLGVAAVILLGLAAARAERHGVNVDEKRARAAGLAVAFSAALTPWLFETSRLVFEVALMPLALVLLLLALARTRGLWTWADSLSVALALALVTYTYSVGRLLGPLLALGLLLFARRGGFLRAVIRTWLVYAGLLIPLLLFAQKNAGALGERFAHVTFVRPGMTWTEITFLFTRKYLWSFSPLSWFIAGDPEPRHHLQVFGSLLIGATALAITGVFVVLRERREEPFWRFALYGLAVSPIPASLTLDHFHTLRLIALPVFLFLFIAPAVTYLLNGSGVRVHVRRRALTALLALTFLQAAAFQFFFHRDGARRTHNFDALYTQVFDAALAQGAERIYIIDAPGAPGYMHAYWYATLRGIDPKMFVRVDAPPPAGSLVISTETPCTRCRTVSEAGPFRAYFAE